MVVAQRRFIVLRPHYEREFQMVRFSLRTAWRSDPNPLTQAVAHAVASGRAPIDLTRSNPTSVELPYTPDLLAPLGSPEALRYEPTALGLDDARAFLAQWLTARGQPASAARTVLTASSSESYSYLFHLLADPGDEVLVPAPSYPLFGFLADLAGVRLVTYPLRYDGAWHIDLGALEAAVSERTRALIVVSPNNPTGSCVQPAEVTVLRALCAGRSLALISDEVFFDYPLGPRLPTTLAGPSPCLSFVLGGLSKLAGLPQVKLGWMLVGGPDDLVEAALARLELVADTFLSVGTPVQRALPALLRSSEVVAGAIRERCRRNLGALREAVRGSAATVLDVEGGWCAVVRLPATRREEDWVLALLAGGVLVHPGHFFDFDREPFVVVSLLPTEGEFDRGVEILRTVVDQDG